MDFEEEADEGVSLRRRLLRAFFKVCVFGAIVSGLAAAGVLAYYDRLADGFDIAEVGRTPTPSSVVDARGDLIGYIHTTNVGLPVKSSQMAEVLRQAIVAREDSRFYRHRGVDYRGVLRAWVRNAQAGRYAEGASTITMQLARMSFQLKGKTLHRKVLECRIARRIEREFSKDEILTFYMNRVFLGTGMKGVEQAAKGYFGKTAETVSPNEAAMIAGIIRAPNGFSPFRNEERALREMRMTIRRMRQLDMITSTESVAALASDPKIQPEELWRQWLRERTKQRRASYLLTAVELEMDKVLPSRRGSGGLIIHTSFDLALQDDVQSIATRELSSWEASTSESASLQCGIAVTEASTGAIRALIGGRDPSESSFNRATSIDRSIGSVVKPFVYVAALASGLLPGTHVSGSELSPEDIPWFEEQWSPVNSDNQYPELVPAIEGLTESKNTVAVRVGEAAGYGRVRGILDSLGFGASDASLKGRHPSLYLGAIGGNPLVTAAAYGSFLTDGERQEPYFIEKVVDADEVVLMARQNDPPAFQVLRAPETWMMRQSLLSVYRSQVESSGLSSPGDQYFGGKSGTTNDFRDAWFAGFSERLACAVWVGNDDGKSMIGPAFGGRLAFPIWFHTMTRASALGYVADPPQPPENSLPIKLCRESGNLATAACDAAGLSYIEMVPESLIPRELCRTKK